MLGELLNRFFASRADQSMLALGDFRFSVRTAAPQEVSRESSWEWSSQNRIGREPALQFMGGGGETLRINGVIYPHYRGGFGQIAAMRAMGDLGEPLQLISGSGELLGRWVIERVSERAKVLDQNGRPRRQDFDLTLKKYGEDWQ